jgi:hypothetical protein
MIKGVAYLFDLSLLPKYVLWRADSGHRLLQVPSTNDPITYFMPSTVQLAQYHDQTQFYSVKPNQIDWRGKVLSEQEHTRSRSCPAVDEAREVEGR